MFSVVRVERRGIMSHEQTLKSKDGKTILFDTMVQADERAFNLNIKEEDLNVCYKVKMEHCT